MSRRRSGGVSLQTRLVAGSVLLAILIAAAFVILILALSTLREATREEAESRDVTAEALMVQKLVLDLETGVRGYVITGRRSFLAPYEAARKELPSHLRRLEELAADEPSQRRRAQDLVAAIRDYLAYNAEPVLRFSGEVGLVGPPRDWRRRVKEGAVSATSACGSTNFLERKTSLWRPERVPPTRARRSRSRSGSADSRLRLGSSSSLRSTLPARSHGRSGKPPRARPSFPVETFPCVSTRADRERSAT